MCLASLRNFTEVHSRDQHRAKVTFTVLIGSYIRRFERFGDVADIDKAIHYLNQAVLLTPDGLADKPRRFTILGAVYRRRFQRLGDISDIEKAITCQSQAVPLAPDNPTKLFCLSHLGDSYQARFIRDGNLGDINRAIEYQSQAVLLTPNDDACMPGRLESLGHAYLCRFDRLAELSSIEMAIKCHRQAVLLTPDDREVQDRVSGLGCCYFRKFERFGELPDLNEAIECHTEAVRLAPDDNPGKPFWLSNLGGAYIRRFEFFGNLADIDKGTECLSRAVMITPDDHADKPAWLNNLGTSYMYRFRRLEEVADVDKAINYHNDAVLLTPDGSAEKPIRLNSLGMSHLSRYTRLGRLGDLGKAIDCMNQAMLLTPNGHAVNAVFFYNLGNLYRRRFEDRAAPEDISAAINYLSQAALLTPDGHPNKPDMLIFLGSSYLDRFERQGEFADIDMAINYQNRALLLAPDGHVNTPALLKILGDSYLHRYQCTGEFPDLTTAGTCFQKAAQCISGYPYAQFRAARIWAKVSLCLGISPLPAYRRAMELVQEVVWLGNTIEQRYTYLIDIGDIGIEAAAWAISLHDYHLALEWLEEGRSIVWSQIFQLRTPFDELSVVNADMAQRLLEIGCELERAGSRSELDKAPLSTMSPSDRDAKHHHDLATEWGQLLKQARQIPGFSDFMRPQKADSLLRVAKDGPVIVINLHGRHCDALIIRPNGDGIAHVPLGNFSLEEAENIRTKLASLVGYRVGRAGGFKRSNPIPNPEEMFKGILMVLWSGVVKPILDYLGYAASILLSRFILNSLIVSTQSKSRMDELPHVTWCTTGTLSFLPLHAAGDYNGSQLRAFDLVVSSYVPSLGVLLSPGPPGRSEHPGMLVVGQENTKGFSNLPNTVQELEAIKEHAEEADYLQLDGENATVDAVLSAMDKYSWIHLACHATQSKRDLAQSAFHLHNGDLTLSAIAKKSFKNKGLAFLSACQTATGDERLPDEAVHLAAGMMMAGYPSVIATMWAIQDADAPEVSRQVYADLLKGGKMNTAGAARALHKSVAGLRGNVGETSFERWVPFVHIGS